jgi:N6-adenosine-specific RNA methylase IME4
MQLVPANLTAQLLAQAAEPELARLTLCLLDYGRHELERARSVDALLRQRDGTLAAEELLARLVRGRAHKLAAQNHLAELRLRQERRIGRWLADHVNHSGGGDRRSASRGATPVCDLPPGITRAQSSRFQMIASLPETLFEAHLAAAKAAGHELSTAGLVRLVKQLRRPGAAAAPAPPSDLGCTVADLGAVGRRGLRFGTVYADPPWPYTNQATRGSATCHYPTMSLEAIAALPVAELAAAESHCHLWTTNAFLFEAPRILRAWNFEFKSILVWVKPQMGLGNYWRCAHEFLITGVRNGCGFRDHAQRSWLQAERGRHSVKPEVFRALIERVSPGPYLELFGRQATVGWTVWGNEVERGLFEADLPHLDAPTEDAGPRSEPPPFLFPDNALGDLPS